MINTKEFLNSFIDNKSIELISIIGSGSYGVVYLGKHVYNNRFYAVKCVQNTGVARNEIEMHSTLSGHPNILTLEKVIHERNHVFIVMEYATHGDLFSSITQSHLSKKLIGKTKVIRHLFVQILDAVQHCHYNLVAHRDLKPENLLLLSNNRVKLADFGLTTSQMLSKEFNCGSSFYFSPECQGIIPSDDTVKSVAYYDTFANDIWSLGVILINLVSGRNPWKQANMHDPAFVSYVKNPKRFFRATLPGISKSLDRILIRIFCLDPVKRITLGELRTAILECPSFIEKPKDDSTGAVELKCTDSLTNTMLAYVGDYIDDSEQKKSPNSSKSSSSNKNEALTPRNGSPLSNFYICKLQQKLYEQEYIKNYDH